MNIALLNLEPHIENTAMMQVSRYHKDAGDKVEFYGPIKHRTYDRIYCFSIFDFTSKALVTPDMICGGSGFPDLIMKRLPAEIEACDYDYSLFPNSITSYIWFSRGCFRKCPFCIVRQKEGFIHPVTPKNLNPNGEYISIMDNNFFGSSKWCDAVEWLLEKNQPVDFQSGIDVRIMNEEQGQALQTIDRKLGFVKQLHTAWDNPRDEESVINGINELTKWIKPFKVMAYVLIGYWSTPEEDMHRIETLRSMKIDPYVMPYNKQDPYQRRFRDWVNAKDVWKSVKWKDYKSKKDEKTVGLGAWVK